MEKRKTKRVLFIQGHFQHFCWVSYLELDGGQKHLLSHMLFPFSFSFSSEINSFFSGDQCCLCTQVLYLAFPPLFSTRSSIKARDLLILLRLLFIPWKTFLIFFKTSTIFSLSHSQLSLPGGILNFPFNILTVFSMRSLSSFFSSFHLWYLLTVFNPSFRWCAKRIGILSRLISSSV